MALKLADDGAGKILGSYFNKTVAGTYVPVAGDNLTLHLFVNDITPANDGSDTTVNYTEAAGGGYAAITLTAGNWTISKVGGIQQAAYAARQFVFTGPLTTNPDIHGYYVTDADGNLIFAERDASPFTPLLNGDYYEVTPIFQGSGGTPA